MYYGVDLLLEECLLTREVEAEIQENPRVQELCQAILACGDDEDLLLRLLRDTFTAYELVSASNRFAAAQLLLSGKTQVQTQRELGLSSKTVQQVGQWATGSSGTGGFVEIRQRLLWRQPTSQSDDPQE